MALIVRTFDFGTTMSLPKWPTKRWDFVTALILDLVCESFSFDEKDYYMEEKQKTSKSVTTNKMELGEEIRLLRELFRGKCV